MYIHTNICIFMHICIYIYIYIYTNMYVFIYIYEILRWKQVSLSHVHDLMY
jgi:hypothetical protein